MDDPSHTTKCRTNTKHPTYRGIRCKSGKWVSEIREPRKTTRIWLGTYPTPHMAAAAYDVAALAIKGTHNIVLNFPHHLHSYPNLPPSPSPADIRRAAATAAAAMFDYDDRPSESMGGGATCSERGSSENIRRAAATAAAAMSSPEGDYDDRPSGSRSGATCNEGGSSENCAMQIENMEITKGGEGYVDEEELFDFPSLLVNMAEAMMLSPPRINSSSSLEDHSHGDSDVESLWSY